MTDTNQGEIEIGSGSAAEAARAARAVAAGARALETVAAATVDLDRAARSAERMAAVVVANFGAMAEAAIVGSDRMTRVVIQGFTEILQALALRSSPVLGAAVGAFGGILGALFGGDERRSVQPVRLEEYGSRALDQRRERRDGPEVISLVLVTQDGEVLDEIEYTLGRNTRRDAVVRLPSGYPRGGRG